jgi:hypothetical protein
MLEDDVAVFPKTCGQFFGHTPNTFDGLRQAANLLTHTLRVSGLREPRADSVTGAARLSVP